MQPRKHLSLVVGLVLACVAHVALEQIRFSRVTYPSFGRDEKVCRTHNVSLATILYRSEWIESPDGGVGTLCFFKKTCAPCNRAANRPHFITLLFHWSTVGGLLVLPCSISNSEDGPVEQNLIKHPVEVRLSSCPSTSNLLKFLQQPEQGDEVEKTFAGRVTVPNFSSSPTCRAVAAFGEGGKNKTNAIRLTHTQAHGTIL
jgi:hypothetical protein